MKHRYSISLMTLAAATAATAGTSLEQGRWSIVNSDNNILTVSFDGKEAIKEAYAEVTYRISGSDTEATINTSALSPASVSVIPFEDELGTGKSLTRVYDDGTATMTQTLNLYDNTSYMIARVSVQPDAEGAVIESNRMIPLATDKISVIFSGSANMVWVPFDNDGHGRYEVYSFNREMTSHEVGCVYDTDNGMGLVAGSVDHDKWKSGITIAGGTSKRALNKLELLSGYTSKTSRDWDWDTDTAVPHGYVKGEKAESARYLVGIFDDWRVGMETFAEACATITPPAPWDGGNPMGWSTWGVMMNYVNIDAIKETSQWIKDNLFDLGFHDKNDQTVVSLDSFCDGYISPSDLSQLGNRFLGSGTYTEGRVTKQGLNQRLGLYGGMVIWDWTFDSEVPGTGTGGIPTYRWGEALLKYNGKEHRLFQGGNYCAIDPTHPAFRYNMEATLKRWSAYKIKYIKMDFINAGICEGDSWYDPEVTTGVMAYNYGMKIIYELAQKYDMYIVESMAPLFPYQWAHGRRTCCDRFSELGESEYVMNAMSWAWWTDRLYAVNDPDQLVLHKNGYNHNETEGENRVRVTTGVCTGAFIIGDSFSDKCVYTDDNGHTSGDVVGYPEESKARALKMFGNADINAYVRENTGSFRPVDGSTYTTSQQTGYTYMRDTPGYLYVAVFNFNKNSQRNGAITYSSIGIDPSNVKEIKELWTGELAEPLKSSFNYSVPAGDVCLYRIEKVTAGVDEILADTSARPSLSAVISGNECVVAASSDMSSVMLCDLSGRCLRHVTGINSLQTVFDVNVQGGVYIVKAILTDGTTLSRKIMAR